MTLKLEVWGARMPSFTTYWLVILSKTFKPLESVFSFYFSSLQQSKELAITPTWQIWKLRHRERLSDLLHFKVKWQSQNLNPGTDSSRACALKHYFILPLIEYVHSIFSRLQNLFYRKNKHKVSFFRFFLKPWFFLSLSLFCQTSQNCGLYSLPTVPLTVLFTPQAQQYSFCSYFFTEDTFWYFLL